MASAGAVIYGAFLIAFEQPMGKLLGLALVLTALFASAIGWWVALGRPRQWFPPGVNSREVLPAHHRPGGGRRRTQ